jgi:hypothetical protein
MQADSKANSAITFRQFVRSLHGADPVLAPFKVHVAANDIPGVDSWAEIRSYLFRTGAQHEAVVGARALPGASSRGADRVERQSVGVSPSR